MPRRFPGDVDLQFLFEAHKRDVMLSFNCHAIARVESFDSSNQTVRASMVYQKTFYDQTQTGKFEERQEDYPLLIDCPAVVLKGGAFSIKMPIKKGDECLVIFNDRSIDQWFATGSNKRLDSNRLHAFNDAIVLVGLSSSVNSLTGYQPDKMILGNGTTEIALGERVSIKNGTSNLKQILTDLITAVGMATNVNTAKLTEAQTAINGLLE